VGNLYLWHSFAHSHVVTSAHGVQYPGARWQEGMASSEQSFPRTVASSGTPLSPHCTFRALSSAQGTWTAATGLALRTPRHLPGPAGPALTPLPPRSLRLPPALSPRPALPSWQLCSLPPRTPLRALPGLAWHPHLLPPCRSAISSSAPRDSLLSRPCPLARPRCSALSQCRALWLLVCHGYTTRLRERGFFELHCSWPRRCLLQFFREGVGRESEHFVCCLSGLHSCVP